MTFRITVEKGVGAEFRALFETGRIATSASYYDEIKTAATVAVTKAGAALKTEGRAHIGSAGFSRKWQNAWRVNIYPKTGTSLTAAAFAYHAIPYSLIYETGGTIRGKAGMMWIPLAAVPKSGQKKMSARQLASRGVKLFTLQRAGHAPILATKTRGAASVGARGASLAKLAKGTKGKRGDVQTIPLFVGISAVNVRKRLDLERVAQSVSSRLGTYYFEALEA